METWKIYKHTNKTNGKCYIGQTCRKNPNERWNNGKSYNGTIFAKAIEKYGWDNFDHEIIEDNILTQEEANEREQYWIEYYGSYGENGYNMTRGGDDRSDKGLEVYQIDPETLKVIKEYKSALFASRENNNATIAFCCNREEKYKHYVKAAGFYWCYKKDWSENWQPKIGFEHRVCQIDKDGNLVKIWESASKAADALNYNASNGIIRVCKRKRISFGGFYWCYYNELENWEPLQPKPTNIQGVLCVETGVSFISVAEAERITGVNYKNIISVCAGRSITAGGYHWKYVLRKNQRCIVNIETGEKFLSVTDAAKATNIPRREIQDVLSNRRKSARGTKWEYLEARVLNGFNKHHKIVCVETKEIFETYEDAGKKYNINPYSISKCCKGKSKTTGGYHWKYINKDED